MIKARVIFEAQSNHPRVAEDALKEILRKLKNFNDIEIYDVHWEPTEFIDAFYSAMVDLGINFESFETFFKVLLHFGPSAVVIEEPQEIKIDLGELQRSVNDMLAVLHAFAQANVALKAKLRALGKK